MTRELDDFDRVAVAGIEGPLFAAAAIASGPFADSPERPTAEEVLVGEMLWKHQGHAHAVALADVAEVAGLDQRVVKGIVQRLRQVHRCRIGSNHHAPSGFFWIVDEEDRRIAVGGFHSQILAMCDTLRVIDSRESVAELMRRMREKL